MMAKCSFQACNQCMDYVNEQCNINEFVVYISFCWPLVEGRVKYYEACQSKRSELTSLIDFNFLRLFRLYLLKAANWEFDDKIYLWLCRILCACLSVKNLSAFVVLIWCSIDTFPCARQLHCFFRSPEFSKGWSEFNLVVTRSLDTLRMWERSRLSDGLFQYLGPHRGLY